MTTRLTELVQHHTTNSVEHAIARAIDDWAEDMARELLRDPEFKAEIQQLLRAAFRRTLTELNEAAP